MEIDEQGDNYNDVTLNPLLVGDKVYLKPRVPSCDEEWSGPHVITKILSKVSVEINDDGVARHISFLRIIPGSRPPEEESCSELELDLGPELDSCSEFTRPIRKKQRPEWHNDYIFY